MPAALTKVELFARLEQGHAAQVAVVTPNRRLAQDLQREFDAHQIAKGLSVWEAPDLLPFGAFVERLWEDALYSDLGEKLPLLLTPAQEQHLWQEILKDSSFLLKEGAARQCRDAWRLLHQWRIGPASGTEDAAAFSAWSKEYQRRTREEVDSARLPDLMAEHLAKLKKPKLLVAYAFDVVPPQTQAFLEKFELARCAPDALTGSCARTSYPSATQEIEAAAKWARARLEEGKARVGVVIPDLGPRRAEVVRVFSRVMQPGYNFPGTVKAAMPFNVSLGKPLNGFPLVAAALDLLELAFQPVDFARASHLIRSPFLGGADTEMSRRATLDARVRKDADSSITLAKLIGRAEPCPILRKHLEAVFEITRTRPESPAEWARHFSALLQAAGFPGERAPDSGEFQARAKWHEALGELSKLERLAQKFSFAQALSFLKGHCTETLFQPESPDAPIQVLGVLESAGLRFDCLWVSGLTDEAWPLAARPNPFLPIAAQKKAGIPQASAEASAALDRRLTDEWKSAAAEVIFSWPAKDKDKDLAPSPLILQIEHKTIVVPEYPRYRDLLFQAKSLESFRDAKAPPVPPGKVRGGTRVLADQAACPFRAFAKWRLEAKPLEEPESGLDARDRGKLLHALMREIWTRLRGSAALKENLSPVIAQAAAAAVTEMGLEGRFAELERERLAKLAREWLELETRRAPFEVAFLEQQRDIKVAGLEFQSRIDRMDKLNEGGGHVLIDYKSSRMLSPRQWDGPRPDDPQLPLYAVAAPEELAAVVFAKVRPGEMRFMGFSRSPNVIPQVSAAHSWPALLAAWKKDADALGKSFASGEAQVDPKEGLKTCRLCELHTLCRVYEKFSALRTEEGGG
ncbi:MAG TPA: PD-(D/E)XK nuclease family protein [Burkholderiales bacterium]|nr:PD-(D/E)XK nuclease family protein [Burkholderiales bacterium]